MSKSTSYKIRPRGTSWQVDFGRISGKHLRKSFKSKTAAGTWARQKQAELSQHGNLAFELTDQERINAIQARKLLPDSVTLIDAAQFFIKHTAPQGREIKVNDLITEYLAAKEASGLRPAYISGVKTRLKTFARSFGDSLIHTIAVHDLEQWLEKGSREGPYRGRNRQSYIRHLSGLFAYAVRKRYAKQSPVGSIERVKVNQAIPEVLTVDEVRKLLTTAEKHEPAMLPYLALGIFTGLRPDERKRLDWKHIDLGKKSRLWVDASVAKARRSGFVDISRNLLEWLAPYKQNSGLVYWNKKRFNRIRTLAEVKIPGKEDWPQRIERHSFASYHLAMYEDAAKTAKALRHWQGLELLADYYQNCKVDKEMAEKFWDIRPSSIDEKIIKRASE